MRVNAADGLAFNANIEETGYDIHVIIYLQRGHISNYNL